MKRRFVIMLLVGVFAIGVSGCGKDEVDTPIGIIVSSEESSQESTDSGVDKWNGSQSNPLSNPDETKESQELSSTTEVKESSEVNTDSSESIQEEKPIEIEEPVLGMVSEEDLVHVIVPEENKGVQDLLYGMAAYKVEGDITINENIDFGIRLDSDDVRKLITIIYEGTGCTSHKISDEYFAIFDYDEFDYSAKIELNTGEVYYIYLVDGKCYALNEY